MLNPLINYLDKFIRKSTPIYVDVQLYFSKSYTIKMFNDISNQPTTLVSTNLPSTRNPRIFGTTYTDPKGHQHK